MHVAQETPYIDAEIVEYPSGMLSAVVRRKGRVASYGHISKASRKRLWAAAAWLSNQGWNLHVHADYDSLSVHGSLAYDVRMDRF